MVVNIRIGITGLPQVGKTQALLKVISLLEDAKVTVGGMVTEAIIEDGRRVGFYVEDWVTKERAVMAHVDLETKTMVGEYGVDLEAIDRVGVPAIERAIGSTDVIIIDEVGKMEVESPQFSVVVKKALETDKPILLTLHKKSRNPLLQDIRRRDDVRILEVTNLNKDFLPFKILRLLEGE
ncbi:MAG: NTPase [Thermoplasmata archaeon]|nr:NTPase [Thermoplasmata archaeon]